MQHLDPEDRAALADAKRYAQAKREAAARRMMRPQPRRTQPQGESFVMIRPAFVAGRVYWNYAVWPIVEYRGQRIIATDTI